MREIPLANGRGVAIVDDEDYPRVARYSWVLYRKGVQSYAIHRYQEGDKRRSLRMHRLIMPDVALIDHWDGNGLNNTRANLRAATKSQNAMNTGKGRDKRTSRYKGVSFSKKGGKGRPWLAQIQVDGVVHHLGFHTTAELAAHAYNRAARKYYGEFARLNFPKGKPARTARLPQREQEVA